MIRTSLPRQDIQRQPTAATSFVEQYEERFKQQLASGTPRSRNSWSAEQRRPGSWNSGVGDFRAVGVGPGYQSGVGRQTGIVFDPDEIERQSRVARP